MPTWVYNRLEVSGPRAELAAFVSDVSGEPGDDGTEPEALDFARAVPPPPKLEVGASPALRPGDVGDGGEMPEWRQWRTEHWGTKWNAMYSRLEGESDEGRVVYRFSTAYSTPDPWLAAISDAHPTLAFVHEYCEEFVQLYGRRRWNAGAAAAEEHVADPHEFAWLDWDDEDEDDEVGTAAEPEPEAVPLDPDAVQRTAQAVLDAVVASRNAQRRRHMYATPADWLTAITERLGDASRCARLMASADDAYATPIADALGPDGELLLPAWVSALVLAAAEAVKAAALLQIRAEGGSDYDAQEQIVQVVVDDAAELGDRAPTGVRAADWQAALLDSLGDAASIMVAADRAGHGWRVADWIGESHPSLLGGARDALVEFASSCVAAIAAIAASDAQGVEVEVEVPSFWDEVAPNSPQGSSCSAG